MEEKEQHLIIALCIGAGLAFVITKISNDRHNMQSSNNRNNNNTQPLPVPAPATPAALTLSDYGTPIIVANSGQLNTIVGYRTPLTLSYADFNQLLSNPGNVLATYSQGDLMLEYQRAYNFLTQIGWYDIFEQYDSQEPVEKMEDMILFTLNLGAGFRLLPSVSPASIPMATVVSSTVTPSVTATTTP